jgi:hypothetical protein
MSLSFSILVSLVGPYLTLLKFSMFNSSWSLPPNSGGYDGPIRGMPFISCNKTRIAKNKLLGLGKFLQHTILILQINQ